MEATTRSVLITGANGFVGSRLCRKFLRENFTVVAGVRKTADLSLLKGLKLNLAYGDVLQTETLPAMVKGVDYIVHNAGVVKVKSPETFYEVNQHGTENLFAAIASHNPKVKRVVYISSLAAAGPVTDDKPVTESDPPHPISEYGRSKLEGEKAALSYADKFPVTAVRPPGVYGPGDKEVFTFFQAVNRYLKPSIGDMSRRIQLVYVEDLCDGIYRATVADSPTGSVYFIAENRAYSIDELITTLQQACGKKGIPIPLPAAIFRLIAAISQFLFKIFNATPMLTPEKADELLASWEVATDSARNEIGFDSRVPFAEGAKRTFEWYRQEGWL